MVYIHVGTENAIFSYFVNKTSNIFAMPSFHSTQGAVAGLVVGLITGMIRMILDFAFPAPLCGDEDTRSPGIQRVLSMHYLYFGIMLFALSLIVVIIVSLLTPPINKKHVSYGIICIKCPRGVILQIGGAYYRWILGWKWKHGMFYWSGDNHPTPSVDVLQKIPSVDKG